MSRPAEYYYNEDIIHTRTKNHDIASWRGAAVTGAPKLFTPLAVAHIGSTAVYR
jgi:hypothetical protein